ncbi:hypothetical protein IG631_18089 [Alternaria alternata]|nr:hypothetical protein IG631_18089 [Alternaria alternata]
MHRVPGGYPRLGFSAATILPSIPSPLLFPHHASTLLPTSYSDTPSAVVSHLHPRFRPRRPRRLPERAPASCVKRQYPLHLPVSAALHSRLLPASRSLPVCLRLTHTQPSLPLSPPRNTQPAQTASPACSNSGHDYWRATPDMCTVA